MEEKNSLARFKENKTAFLDNPIAKNSKDNINITIKAEREMGFESTIQ